MKHLPDASILLPLNICNKIWISGDFPSDWRKAILIPIPKPGKDPTKPTNYRPIALTSCICKTLERMINRRLVWYLESHKLITNVQCGFRSRRSTVDHLVIFETFCREAFIHNQHMLSVFFDLEKAYDTTWKYGIMKDLPLFGLRGRLPTGDAGRMKLSCVVPTSVIRIWPIHISWVKILHLSVFSQFVTFWCSAIILIKKGKIYLVEEMWNRIDSTPHYFCCFKNKLNFTVNV